MWHYDPEVDFPDPPALPHNCFEAAPGRPATVKPAPDGLMDHPKQPLQSVRFTIRNTTTRELRLGFDLGAVQLRDASGKVSSARAARWRVDKMTPEGFKLASSFLSEVKDCIVPVAPQAHVDLVLIFDRAAVGDTVTVGELRARVAE